MTEPTVLRGRESSTVWLGLSGACTWSGAAGAKPKLKEERSLTLVAHRASRHVFSTTHSTGRMGDGGQRGARSTHYSFSESLSHLLLSGAADWLAGPLPTHFLRTAPSHKSDSGLGGEAGGRYRALPVVGC